MMFHSHDVARYRFMLAAAFCCVASQSFAQSVGLPAPRLLTTSPMGAKVGSQVEITISGEHIEDAEELTFSDRRITAVRKKDAAGLPEPNGKYVVTTAADCPVGIHEARVMTRLGISSSRAFSVGTLDLTSPVARNFSCPMGPRRCGNWWVEPGGSPPSAVAEPARYGRVLHDFMLFCCFLTLHL